MSENPAALLDSIVKHVEQTNPAIVVVDSFRTVMRAYVGDLDLQAFLQRLALHLTSWQVTSFLVGEYGEGEMHNNPVFTIDSLNGLELALSPCFREDFRESLYRMVGALTGGGVSTLLTFEVTESFDKINFSPHTVSFVAHNIIFLRYAEIDGQHRKVLTVAKMRRSQHSPYLHAYEITSRGMRVTEPLTGYRGICG